MISCKISGDSLGIEEKSSRSRRGSRVGGLDDDQDSALSKLRRASRIPGQEIVEVTNAYKAKNDLSVVRGKKERKSMRKKKKKNKKEKEEEEQGE